jgi:hypothetical protein
MQETKMHNCRFCKNPLRPWAEWKGDDGQVYCNEFCADAGSSMPVMAGAPEMIAAFRSPSA